MSGTPTQAFAALQRSGLEMIDLSPETKPQQVNVLQKVQNRIKRVQNYVERHILNSSSQEYKRFLRMALARSLDAQQRINNSDVDVIVGICISTVLSELNNDKPIIYASDTTARLINTSYDEWKNRSQGYHDACDEIEKKALHKCAYFLPAAECAQESAVEDYKMVPERVKLLEFGAHVRPDASYKLTLAKPSPQNLNLVLVAADPIRKRLAFCVDVVEKLNERGWEAKLNYIGAKHPLTEHPLVNYYGRLQLSNDDDRQLHAKVMEESHWMILPSEAEAFGIAPCEAAHFRRPSIVSDVGGLPTVVKHNITGLVMAEPANSDEYADALIAASSDLELYEQMSDAALDRAKNVLSWDAWARQVKALILDVIK